MIIRPYNQGKDEEVLAEILRVREVDVDYSLLPRFGFVAIEDDVLLAFGFMRYVEGPYAMIDGLTTNPNVEVDKRRLALSRILDKMIRIGKRYRLRALMGFTGIPVVSDMVEGKGFSDRSELKLKVLNYA